MTLYLSIIGGYMENLEIIGLFSSILGRKYSIVNSLSFELQEVMNEIEVNINSLYKEFNYCDYVVNSNIICYDFLDMVTLYQELDFMIKDLNTCMFFLPNDFRIEDSISNIYFIMKKIAEDDCVFRYCYNKGKNRILK